MTTHATGWHASGERSVHRADTMSNDPDWHWSCRPVLVVDPTAARDVIARAIFEDEYGDEFPGLTWENAPDRAPYLSNADAVLAALTEAGEG